MVLDPIRALDSIPSPSGGVSPVGYAETLAQWFCARTEARQRKQAGQYFTPPDIALFMADLCEFNSGGDVALDVGAGTGMLSCALIQHAVGLPNPQTITIHAYETDPLLAALLRMSLSYAQQWAAARGLRANTEVREEDFVLANASALDMASLFVSELERQYTLAVLNPPYFKLRKSDLRARVAHHVVHGQPNIYALCMSIAAHLLVEGGSMVSLTPRSFATGEYFRVFREKLFRIGVPDVLHLFESRKDAFGGQEVLQENLIMRVRRITKTTQNSLQGATVSISASHGLSDLRRGEAIDVPLRSVVDLESQDKMLFIPTSRFEEEVREWVSGWPETLHSLGLRVSTGPVVSFRAQRFLISAHGPSLSSPRTSESAPLLLVNNVHKMRVAWPLSRSRKPQRIAVCDQSKQLLVPAATYVLTRRFTTKEQDQRVVAAPLTVNQLGSPFLGIENHLNYIYRAEGALSSDEAYGLSVLLNSRIVDLYFRLFSGHTQVNATELRVLPLPRLHQIRAMGVRAREDGRCSVDEIVNSVLAPPHNLRLATSQPHLLEC